MRGEIISFFVGVALLYWPYVWCRYTKEGIGVYGLAWDYDRRAILWTLGLTACVIALLTPVALLWPWGVKLPRHRDLPTVLRLLASGLAAAVIEETFFRGWLQTLFRRRLGAAAAIVLTSAVFALCHLFAQPHLIALTPFFPGLVMGYLREKYGNVFPSMLFHFLGNVWAIWFFPSSFF